MGVEAIFQGGDGLGIKTLSGDHMRYYFVAALFGVFVLGTSNAHGQVFDRTIIRAGDNLADYFTYRFPSFTDAIILFKNRGPLISKMNFNMLTGEMQFISPKGDTLAVSKPEDIDSIRLNNCVFFFNKGYFEIIAAFDSVRLVVFRKVSFESVKIGAMGAPVRSAAVDDYNVYLSSQGPRALFVNQDLYVFRKTIYFLIEGNGEAMTATRSNFLKIFTGNRKSVENFIKLNNTNFEKQADLDKLFHFCIQPKM
jgi:hypothetical protein